MKTLPGSIAPPAIEVIVHCRPGRKVARQLTPLAARLQDIEDRIDDLAHAELTRAPDRGARQQRLDRLPGTVTEVARVAFFLRIFLLHFWGMWATS